MSSYTGSVTGSLAEVSADLIQTLSSGVVGGGIGSSISIGGSDLLGASLLGNGLFVNSVGDDFLSGQINGINLNQLILGQGAPQF